MKNAKKAYTRGGKSGSSKSRLQVDQGGHSVPGFLGQDGAPSRWEARTGYTSENRTGASSKGTTINLPGKSA